jgi:acetyltransferase-like isoleucine patch superfamily enzyme
VNKLFSKIPVLRSLIREKEKLSFHNEWRKRNPHNLTRVGSRFFPFDVVSVGKGTYGDITVQSLYVTPQEKLIIGNYVSIAPDVLFLLGVNHQTETVTTYPFYSMLIERSPIDAITKGPIIIEDEVWIGTEAKIFSGVRIGKGAIVAAGAIVTKDVLPYAIVGGNPAKLIKYRFSEEIIRILMPIYFINFSDEWIKENIETLYRKIETIEDALLLKKLMEV